MEALSRMIRCEKHPHLKINTYCHTDKQVICAECVVDFHKGHEIERLANVVQRFQEEISQLTDKVSFSFSFFFIHLLSFLSLLAEFS